MACARTERRLASKQPTGSLLEPHHFPKLHVEGFDDAVAGDGLVQNVLDLCQFVLSLARGLPHLAADSAGRPENNRNKEQQHPGQLAAQNNLPRQVSEDEGKELLQQFRQHRRHGKLHPLDVVDQG